MSSLYSDVTTSKYRESPNLKPTEHLWDVVELEIFIMDVQPKICSNCLMLSCQYEPKSLNNVSRCLFSVAFVSLSV